MKFLFAIGFIFANLFSADSQENKVTNYPMAESSLLWEISGPNVQPSYLFGTMHLIEKGYFIFPKKLEKIAKKSEVLLMEMAGIPDAPEIMKHITLKEGSFFDIFTVEQSDSILRWAKEKFQMDERTFRASFGKMKPLAVVQLSVQLYFMGKTESYELTFEKLAQENGIAIKGLETVADQMQIFDNLTDEQQVEMVMETIRDMNHSVEIVEKMQQIYSRQQIDSLYMFVSEEGGIIEEEQNAFLDERNKKWIPQIKALIAEKRTFIAVGAGHLGGPNGVIRLLEKEGYTLKPIEL